jgi:hypothetical protein
MTPLPDGALACAAEPESQHSATRHEFVPKLHYNQFSGLIEPALHLKRETPYIRPPRMHAPWIQTEHTSPPAVTFSVGRFMWRAPGRATRS